MAAVWTDKSKASASTYAHQEKPDGQGGQFYDEANMFYDVLVDVDSSSEVFYDGTGAISAWSDKSKASTSFSNQSKS